MDFFVLPSYRTSQALIMGTMSIANAMGFAPNFQKGITAASSVFQLLNRKPQIYDPPHDGKDWVSGLLKRLSV
jgi:ATP-binding cassette subfamily B (MDR/TAP) protein 1